MGELIRCLCGNMYNPGDHSACPECGRQPKSSAEKSEHPEAMTADKSLDTGAERRQAAALQAPPATGGIPGWIWKAVASATGVLFLAILVSQLMRPDDSSNDGVADQDRSTAIAGGSSASSSDPDATSCNAIIGRWAWSTGGLVTFENGGNAYFQESQQSPQSVTGRWTCDTSRRQYTVTWSHGFIDTLSVSADGRQISGTNNINAAVAATRVSSP